MKIILKKALALSCASAVTAVCYPGLRNNTSLAETLETNNSISVKNVGFLNTDGKTPPRPGAIYSAATTKLFTATAYALRGQTSSGWGVRRGVIAADPRILPLGTRVQINAGKWSGTYLVADTGGVIKGHIIDVWVPSVREARKFGRRKLMLTIVGR
jgi:3D (Asp-Asp-Asp) domain-containing protein